MFFIGVSMAGQIMSISLGISAAQLFNPTMGESSTAFDQLFVTIASLFFLAINGHHILISGIFDSFALVPIAKTGLALEVFGHFGEVCQKVMAVALKMSAPIMVSILFMNVAIAVVGRAVPQINILITSLPINILAGFFIMMVALPLLLWEMRDFVQMTAGELFRFVKAF
jgi:flagellar biosynthetic protein FliR